MYFKCLLLSNDFVCRNRFVGAWCANRHDVFVFRVRCRTRIAGSTVCDSKYSLVTGLVKFSHCFHFARTLYSRCLYYVRLTYICHKKTRHTTTTLNTRPFKSNYIKLNFARNVTKYYIYNFKFLAFVRILFFAGLIIILLQKWKISCSSYTVI